MKFKRLTHGVLALAVSLSALLNVSFAPLTHAATTTWTGIECLDTGDQNMMTATNWSSGVAPVAGDTLVFPDDPTCRTVNNNFPAGTIFAGITFTHPSVGTYSDYSFSGNKLGLASGASITTNANTQSVENLNLPIELNGNITVVTNGATVGFDGVISGTGSITISGSGSVWFDAANTFSGSVVANNLGSVIMGNASGFGNSTNTVTINDGADLAIGSCTGDFTVLNPLTLTGASAHPTGAYPAPKLMVGSLCSGSGANEAFGGDKSTQNFTLSGTVTLGSDITFGAAANTTTVNGGLSGGYVFTLLDHYSGSLIVNSPSNVSHMANGTYQMDVVSATLSDSQPSSDVAVQDRSIVTIDGTRGDVTVSNGGLLKGTGTLGALAVSSGGTVAPGHSPGCMNTGDLTLNGIYQFEVKGSVACTDYDQIKVTGTVTIDSATAELQTVLYSGFSATAGQKYVIISNDGTDAVTGTFKGLAEGALLTVGDGQFRISYKGGDGNDVELTVVKAPSTPDTGFELIRSNPALTAITASFGGAVLLAIARRVRS